MKPWVYLVGISHKWMHGVAADPPTKAHSLIRFKAGRLHPPQLAGIVRSSFWKSGISSAPTRAQVAFMIHWSRWVTMPLVYAGGMILKRCPTFWRMHPLRRQKKAWTEGVEALAVVAR